MDQNGRGNFGYAVECYSTNGIIDLMMINSENILVHNNTIEISNFAFTYKVLEFYCGESQVEIHTNHTNRLQNGLENWIFNRLLNHGSDQRPDIEKITRDLQNVELQLKRQNAKDQQELRQLKRKEYKTSVRITKTRTQECRITRKYQQNRKIIYFDQNTGKREDQIVKIIFTLALHLLVRDYGLSTNWYWLCVHPMFWTQE
ncbi:4506_t:CDS:2 [Diversispora eburnea]|uniref:4506_t:CDS:1 n=1 Tax=Diversispora eburnea TaxID=1213867 RepID=A0A9N9A1M7_9GLOM|nr:4506_t:CDS:2 [Diversispora eburnea]